MPSAMGLRQLLPVQTNKTLNFSLSFSISTYNWQKNKNDLCLKRSVNHLI
jgi:hypothetical protein